MHHDLKIWPTFFERQLDRKKPWEVRRMDRPFDSGDTATLREWDPTHQKYTGRTVYGRIPFVMAEVMGIKEGYCVFTFEAEVLRADDFPMEAPRENVSGT